MFHKRFHLRVLVLFSISLVLGFMSYALTPPIQADFVGDPIIFDLNSRDSVDLAWGDVDGDGDLDLAVANYEQKNQIYINIDGELTLNVDAGIGFEFGLSTIETTAVAWGDVDGDGDLDLAVGNREGGFTFPQPRSNEIYRNDNGVFTLATNNNLNTSFRYTNDLAWGDMDRDGDLDLVVANEGLDEIYYNDGNGVFTIQDLDTRDAVSRAVVIGDYNNDGDLDIAIGYDSVHCTRLYYYSVANSFTAYDFTATPCPDTYSLAWGDLNGDGFLDLVEGNNGVNRRYLRTGSPNFAGSDIGSVNRKSNSVVLGDWDNDGDLDLAVGNNSVAPGALNQVYENINGTFYQNIALGWSAELEDSTVAVTWADINGDNKLDLAVGNEQLQINRLYMGTGQEMYADTAAFNLWQTNNIHGVPAWADMDKDGDLDLAISGSTSLRLYRNENGQFVLAKTINHGHFTTNLSWGDYDNDNYLDLAVGHSEGIMLFTSNGATLQTGYQDIILNDVSTTVAWGDIDNDGDLDLAAGRIGRNRVYENDNGTLRFDLDNGWGWEDSNSEVTYDISWGDWDNDGDLDLAVANSGNAGQPNRVYENVNGWLYNIPANNLGWTSAESAGTTSVDWGDYDGDGDLDLAAANGDSLRNILVFGSDILEPNVVYENDNGTLNLNPLNGYGWISPETYPSTKVMWGDWDNDGDLDLLTTNYYFGELFAEDNLDDFAFRNQIYENVNGVLKLDPSEGYGWESANELATYEGEWGDVDNDGDLDIAFGNYGDSANELYINQLYNDTKQANHQPRFYVGQPADLPKANGSGAALLTDTVIPIPYMIADPEGDAVGQIKAFYSPNKGGSWLEAKPQNNIFPTHLSQNHGLAFNGFSSYVSVPDSDEINLLEVGERTIMVWFKADNPNSSTEQVLYEEGGGTNGLNLYLQNGRLYAGAWSDSNGWGESYLNSQKLEPNRWHHAALVLSASQNRLTLYLNGQLASFTTAQTVALHTGDITIGAITNESRFPGANKIFADGNWFDGTLDDLQIWNTALTQADINHYRYDAPANNEPGLVAHWPMNEGSGLTLNEVTSVPSHGTLNGAQWTNTPTLGIFYWDTYASGFFGQSSQMVVRLLAITQPSTEAAAGTYHYFDSTGLAAEPRPYIAATTAPFRVRGTQVQLFAETAARNNEVAGGIVFQRSGPEGMAQLISNPQTNEPYTSNSQGFLDGRGVIETGYQLFAAVPYTKTYRIPPQAVFTEGGDSYGYVSGFANDPESAFTAEAWLLAESTTGSIFKKTNAFALDNPANLQVTIDGQTVSTDISVLDGLPHHVALTWRSSDGQWHLYIDGEDRANGSLAQGKALSSTGVFYIGQGYRGSLDEIRLWDTALTLQAIQNNQYQPINGRQAGLLGYWPVTDEESGALGDLSGNGNNIIFRGSAAVQFKRLYTVYHTSGAPTAEGVAFKTVTEPGVQTLVVTKDNPLMLFDLDVSLEWDASGDPDYLGRLEEDIQRASEILFDLTNGQVAFGQINIYQNKENWWQSDIQVYASNTQRPNANLGGIVTNYMTDTLKTGEVVNNAFLPGKIRIGATWNRYGNPGGTVGEDWPRVLAHEFGHYGLFLLDNYLGVQEVNGSKIIVETDCAGSAMTDAYRQDYSEFLSRITTNNAGFGWFGNCLTTLAEDTTGRSDWETIQKFYPFLNENIATTEVGPTRLPLAVTRVTTKQANNAQTLLTTPVFYINDTLGNLVPFTRGQAQVYLFKEGASIDTADDEILFLGTPSGPLIQARGAAVGDRLCVYDNASQPPRVGCIDNLVDSGASLMLHEVGDWQPQIEVRPVNSTTLEITVQQAAAGAINVQIFPSFRPTSTVEALTGTLTDMGNGVHSGQFQFPLTVFDGHLRVWEEGTNPTRETVTRFANAPGWDGNTFVGFGGNRFIAWGGNRFIAWGGNTFVGFGGNTFVGFGGNTFVGFGGNTFVGFGGNTFVGFGGNTFVGFNAPLASPDGQVILYNVDNILAGNVASNLELLPSVPALPSWLTPVGQAYRYTTQDGTADNLVIQFQYLQRELPTIEEQQLRIYYRDDSNPNAPWTRLEDTVIDDFRNLASAKIQDEGVYVLIATVELPDFQAGWNLFGYPINESRDVDTALESIAGLYSSVFTYEPAANQWLLHDVAVLTEHPEFASYINDLGNLEFGKGYWIYMNQAATTYLGVPTSTADGGQQPPAIYYGTAVPKGEFQPTAGMTVTAWVNGQPCGSAQLESWNGQLRYKIQVQSENLVTAANGCGQIGRIVSFTVGEWSMRHNQPWNNTQANYLTLTNLSNVGPVYLPLIVRP